MKVLIIPSWYPTEDNPLNGIFFKEQALALMKYGCDVSVLYPEFRMIQTYDSRWVTGIQINEEDGIKTYRYKSYNPIPRKIPYTLAFLYYKRLKSLYNEYIKREGRPDVIHAHSCIWGGWAAAKIAKTEKIPLVVTEHWSKIVRGLIKPFEKKELAKALNDTDFIISVGPGLKKELKKYTNKDISEIPNIVNFKIFQETERHHPAKSNTFRFFSLAFLTPNKGMDILLKSFARTFKNLNVELYIGGDGEQKEELIRLTHSLNIESQVKFLGVLDRKQVIVEMKQSDAFVLASRFETFGVVLIEALASGKPIISTNSGGPESIVNEGNGILVPVDDINELSNAMLNIYNNYSDYDHEYIRKDCEERFGEDIIVGKLLKIYNSIK